MAGFGATYYVNDSLVLVSSKSLKLVASATTFSVLNTTSMGNLSAYTGANSGAPPHGTIGLWVYLQAGEITSITLRIGSAASAYTEIAGIKTYTNNTVQEDGWNYFVFKLVNGATTGTPDWTAVDYIRLQFVSPTTPTIVLDYLTIGTLDTIGLNGLGSRITTFTDTTTSY
jgi:hypothetical protein